MRNKHSFIKTMLFLMAIILLCIGIIWWKNQHKGRSVFQEEISMLKQEIGKKEENTNPIIQNKQGSNTQNKMQDTQIIAPVLGTLNEQKSSIENNSSKEQTGYFYTQLDSNAKKIYKAIVKYKENMKSGNYKITLEDSFQEVLKEEGGEEKLKQAYQNAWDALMTDFVDLFYLDVSKIYLFINTTKLWNMDSYEVSIGPKEGENYYAMGYTCRKDVENALAQLEDIREQCLISLKGTDYQKIQQVNDWIVDALSYDKTLSRTNTRNIYGAFIEKQVVCEGYAKAFQYIMDGLQIPSVLVSGTASNSMGEAEAHLWNYVKIEDNWYAVDVTWNDPIIEGNGHLTNQMKHKYLCKGQDFLDNHIPSGKVSQKGMTFTYPTLSIKDYK